MIICCETCKNLKLAYGKGSTEECCVKDCLTDGQYEKYFINGELNCPCYKDKSGKGLYLDEEEE